MKTIKVVIEIAVKHEKDFENLMRKYVKVGGKFMRPLALKEVQFDGTPTFLCPFLQYCVDATDVSSEVNDAAFLEGRSTERPQGEWIPVSERLPDNRDWCLGLFKEPDTDFIGVPYICDYVGEVTKGTTNEGWILRHCTDVGMASDYFRNLICIAWQPLPEPYMEGEQE